MAFSQEENALIRQSLLAEGRRCAVTVGMRKTSVEQLTEAAGISKGSFYKYFASKEMLFLAVLEDIHTEVYQVAREALEAGRDLPPEDRAAEMLLAAVQSCLLITMSCASSAMAPVSSRKKAIVITTMAAITLQGASIGYTTPSWQNTAMRRGRT